MAAQKKILDDIYALLRKQEKTLEAMDKRLTIVEKIGKEFKDVQAAIQTLKADTGIILHESSRIYAKVSDLNCKVDLDICSLNIVNTEKPKKKAVETPIKKGKGNIMSYFKDKMKEDPESLRSFISEEEIEDVYKKCSAELAKKPKSSLEGAKISVLYRELIKNDKERMKKLRSMKAMDDEAESNNNAEPELLEADIPNDEDEDEKYDELYDEDE